MRSQDWSQHPTLQVPPYLEPVSVPLTCILSSNSRWASYHAIVVETQAGAKVCQADVAIHVQQDVVRLDIPEGRQGVKGLICVCSDTSLCACLYMFLSYVHAHTISCVHTHTCSCVFMLTHVPFCVYMPIHASVCLHVGVSEGNC